MKRRSVLFAMLAGTVARSVLAAPPAGRKVHLGVLAATTRAESTLPGLLEAALRRAGYVPGRNIDIAYRFADNHYERMDALAESLVREGIEMIVAAGTPPTLAARKATSTIPIIAVGVVSPVVLGLAQSLAHPGTNVTGVTNVASQVVAKGVEFLRALVPGMQRVGFFMNPDNPSSALTPERVAAAERSYGVKVVPLVFREPADLERELGGERARLVDAVYIRLDATLNVHMDEFARFTLKQRLPAMGSLRRFVEAGGLASYGQSYEEQWNTAAEYVDRIANGARPSEMPIVQPTRFELGVNRRTAAAMGIRIPDALMVRADLVVD